MKKISILLILFVAVLFTACEKDKENVVIKDTITENTLNALTGSPFVLLLDNAALTFQTFSWTPVDYGFDAAVLYTVQADVEGNDFASAFDVVSSDTTDASIKVGDFNKLLLDAGFDPEAALDMEFRVAAYINDNVDLVYSNTVTATITPYATSFPPIYMIGSATGGWDPNLAVEMRSTAPSTYYTVAHFANVVDNNTFRFFKQAGWGDSWNCPYFTGGYTTALLEDALDGDNNFRFIGTTGYYEITANTSAKTVVMAAVDEPVMYMTGSGVGNGAWNWNPGDFVTMTFKSYGVWEATCNFNNGGAFRFFAQAGWGPTSYNYPYFDGGTVTALLANAFDGDSNFSVVGATGTYTISVNILDKIVTMVAVP